MKMRAQSGRSWQRIFSLKFPLREVEHNEVQSSMPAMEADIRFAIVPQHSANPKSSQFAPFVRCERADAAYLNSNRTEIRKTAQRKRGDGKGPWVERSFLRS